MIAESPSWRRGEFEVSSDPDRLDLDTIHAYLTRSYWASGISREKVARSLASSLSLGVYQLASDHAGAEKQVGFARVVSDYVTFAWLGDVFILEEYQGRGLGKFLMECVVAHPQLQGLRRFVLATRDAHGLYSQYGFEPVPDDRFMWKRADP